MRLVLADALPVLDARGWVRGNLEAGDGRVCLTGALKYCDWRPGDWLLARAVLRSRGRAESWNDVGGRTEAEVRALLAEMTITDADLEAVFGPQWEQIVALVRRAAVLSEAEVRALITARAAMWDSALTAARAAMWAAPPGVGAPTAMHAVRDAVRDLDAAWDAVWAAEDAAVALAIRHLISADGPFTQEHYDLLRGPWCRAVGPIHPDDREVNA